MAAELEDAFIRPIHCLYKEYATTIDNFLCDNSLLVHNYDIEDLGDDKDLKLYAKFSEEHDGELARECVQTWICHNRLEVTNCIRIALDNRKKSFCEWFRASEEHPSPDQLLLYCLGKQMNHHVSIFNNKYVWSTLANHIKYDYFEVLKRSSIALVYLGPRWYAILRKKKPVQGDDTPEPGEKWSAGKGRKCHTTQPGTQSSTKKTTCHTSRKKGKTTKTPSKRSVSLQDSHNKKFGIGSSVDTEQYGRGK